MALSAEPGVGAEIWVAGAARIKADNAFVEIAPGKIDIVGKSHTAHRNRRKTGFYPAASRCSAKQIAFMTVASMPDRVSARWRLRAGRVGGAPEKVAAADDDTRSDSGVDQRLSLLREFFECCGRSRSRLCRRTFRR